MSVLLAIDPGPTRSAWVVYNADTDRIRAFAITPNDEILAMLRGPSLRITTAVIEKVEGFGMAVGAEVFETVYWSGQFAEALYPLPVERVGRKAIKVHLCGTHRAKDPNIRQALIDRFGGELAIGVKRAPGPLYGISKDVWSALAVAVSWAEGAR